MANLYTILPGAAPSKGGPEEVGNKAWNLMRMAEIGLPVPPAFVLPTSWCRSTRPADEPVLKQTLSEGIARLESATGLGFGATRRPLLVSVRSGAAVSMPGMMETVLDVGLNSRNGRGPDPSHRQSTAGLGQLPAARAGIRGGGGQYSNGAVRRADSGAAPA